LYHWVPIIEEKLKTLPGLLDVSSDLQIARPQVNVEIDREKASALGVNPQQIEAALANAYGSPPGLEYLYRDEPVLGDPRIGAEVPARPCGPVDAFTYAPRAGRWCRSTR